LLPPATSQREESSAPIAPHPASERKGAPGRRRPARPLGRAAARSGAATA